jgi:hypothetical protein
MTDRPRLDRRTLEEEIVESQKDHSVAELAWVQDGDVIWQHRSFVHWVDQTNQSIIETS